MNARTLLPLVALIAACAGTGPRPAPSPAAPVTASAGVPADYYPLAIGNQWTYRDETPGQAQGQRPVSRTVRIVSRTRDGYFKDSDRGELRADADCLHDRSRQLLCGPLSKGRTWTSVVSVSSTEKYEIVGIGEKLETPAGTFEGCVRVRAVNRAGPGAELVLEITYAPGIGPARIETFALVNGAAVPQFRAVLENVQLQGR